MRNCVGSVHPPACHGHPAVCRCVLDISPRQFDAASTAILVNLAELAAREVERADMMVTQPPGPGTPPPQAAPEGIARSLDAFRSVGGLLGDCCFRVGKRADNYLLCCDCGTKHGALWD